MTWLLIISILGIHVVLDMPDRAWCEHVKAQAQAQIPMHPEMVCEVRK